MTKKAKTQQRKRSDAQAEPVSAASLVQEIAKQKVTIRDAAGSREVTVLEAIILRLQHKAIQGDLRADKRLDALRARLTPREPASAGVLVVPGMLDEAEWIRRAECRNRFLTEPVWSSGTGVDAATAPAASTSQKRGPGPAAAIAPARPARLIR